MGVKRSALLTLALVASLLLAGCNSGGGVIEPSGSQKSPITNPKGQPGPDSK